MNKSVIAGAIIIALGGGAFAGMSIADGKIKELYNQPSIGMAKNIKTTQNLGMMGGTVEWTADLMLDPCKPDDILSLKGTDTIRKGLTGYTIHSEFRPVLTDEKLKAVFDKVPALQAETSFGWSGNGKTKVSLPAHEINEDSVTLKWDKVTFQSQFNFQNNELIARDAQADVANISFSQDDSNAQIKGISYQSDMPMFGANLESGKGVFKVQSFNLNSDGASIVAENFITNVNQKVNADKVDIDISYNLGLLEVKDKEKNFTAQDAKVNVKFSELQRQALEKIVKLMDKSSKECIAQNDLVKQLEPELLNLANAGLKVESKDNQLKIGNSTAIAHAEVVAPTHTYTDLNDIVNKLPTLVTYQLNIEVDKDLVRNLAQMTGKPLSEDELNTLWQQMVTQSGGTVTADRLKIEKKSP